MFQVSSTAWPPFSWLKKNILWDSNFKNGPPSYWDMTPKWLTPKMDGKPKHAQICGIPNLPPAGSIFRWNQWKHLMSAGPLPLSKQAHQPIRTSHWIRMESVDRTNLPSTLSILLSGQMGMFHCNSTIDYKGYEYIQENYSRVAFQCLSSLLTTCSRLPTPPESPLLASSLKRCAYKMKKQRASMTRSLVKEANLGCINFAEVVVSK